MISSGIDTGGYVNPPSAGYVTWTFDKDTQKENQQLSKQVVWKYGSTSNLTLFSHFGSSAQRLPNGNTLICSTTEGYMVEVTSAGQVVWEYICPVTGSGIAEVIGDDLPMTNAAPRVYRYGSDFAGFRDKDMTPGKSIAVCPLRLQGGNVDGDCDIDLIDYALFAQQWLQTKCGLCNGLDLTGDWRVDFADLAIFAANWLAGL
jgi:hypothetical protein